MTRPAPRKSSPAGSSPVTPPVSSLAPVESAAAVPAAAAPAARPSVRAVTKKAGTKYPPKVSFYQVPEDIARVRGAILHTQVTEGTRELLLACCDRTRTR